MKMAARDEIVSFLDGELDARSVQDESLNGLQVQGTVDVSKVGLATDAALLVFRRAAELGCQMIVAHHGILWSRSAPIKGVLYEQLKFLIDRGINLYASHLPLDMHPRLGNNAVLARMVGMEETEPFGLYHGTSIGCSGALPAPMGVEELASAWSERIGGDPLVLPFGPSSIRTVGIVSGGGAALLGEAIDAGLDCYATGEPAHWNHHLALEAGINVIYLGHYSSETPGVRAVGDALTARFGVETVFIDEPTLV
jgi:dinuclear metal center YbgI/SA1388 family protein